MKKPAQAVLFIAVLLSLAACSSAPTPQPAPLASPTAALPPATATSAQPADVPTEVPPTLAPSPTAVPTAEPLPTLAPSPSPVAALAVLDQGFQVWCMPSDTPVSAVKSAAAPNGARIGVYKDAFKETQVVIPASSCTLAYTFNQAIPADVTLEAHYFYGGAAWLSKPLTPAADNSTVGILTLDQPDVLNPPLWQVSYQFVVKSGDQELRKDVVNFYKQVGRCWEGSLPDPVTLDCPHADVREPEPHPDVTPSSPDFIH
jgi:hypothetical protein